MSKLITRVISGAKYVYLIFFFALIAGVFHPLITGASFNPVIIGSLVLFVGLAGAVLVYKAASSEKRRGIFWVVDLD